MKATVVVPVLNEEQTIGAVVRLARSSPVVDGVVVEEDAVAFGAIAARSSLRGEIAAT